jgi:hypothetical protein
MDKAKYLVIGLIGLLLLSVIVNLQTYSTKLGLQQEKDRLSSENQKLIQKAEENNQKAKRLEEKMVIAEDELARLNKEKENFQKKFDLLNMEKQELIDRLKSERKKQLSPTEKKEVGLETLREPSGIVSGADEVYWAGILKTKTDLEIKLTNLRNELKDAQLTNERLQKDKDDLQLDLNIFKREKEDLQRQVEYNKKLLDSIAQELVRERNDKLKIQEGLKTLKKENGVLTRQLKSINNRRFSLEKKVRELQEDKVAVERRFTDLEDKLAEKDSMISGIKVKLDEIRVTGEEEAAASSKKDSPRKDSVELPPIVVRPAAQVPEVRIQQGTTVTGGKILAINRDSNFIIMDLGEEAGVKIGDEFKVYRLDKTIASLEVIQTRRNIAACDIKSEIVPIKIGDSVR